MCNYSCATIPRTFTLIKLSISSSGSRPCTFSSSVQCTAKSQTSISNPNPIVVFRYTRIRTCRCVWQMLKICFEIVWIYQLNIKQATFSQRISIDTLRFLCLFRFFNDLVWSSGLSTDKYNYIAIRVLYTFLFFNPSIPIFFLITGLS